MSDLEINEDNTEQVVESISLALARALERIGLVAEGYAKDLAPYRLGRLRGSITHDVVDDEKAVYIGTNVEYAAYQELGSSKNSYKGANGGKGYLRPAATEHADEYRSILETELRG